MIRFSKVDLQVTTDTFNKYINHYFKHLAITTIDSTDGLFAHILKDSNSQLRRKLAKSFTSLRYENQINKYDHVFLLYIVSYAKNPY